MLRTNERLGRILTVRSDGKVEQLALDGIEPAMLQSKRTPGFTSAQREILLKLRAAGSISSTDAGRITHLHRQPPCSYCSTGSCNFASSDGTDAMKRLAARGAVKRSAKRGRWELAS